MSVVIGTLTIDLKANTASFSQGMDKMASLSAKTATDISRSLQKISAAALAMGAAVVGGTVALVKSAIDSIDAMGKLAQSTGTTVETLSRLSYAASLSNASTEQLAVGLEKLSKNAFAAQNGNEGLARIFSRLGVSIVDSTGHLRDSGVMMGDLAAKFSKIQDGAGKTALAMELFGKSGAGLIPMLNQYGAEQAKVNEEAHQFGLEVSTSTAEVAGAAHDNLDRLSGVFKGMGYALLGATLPALAKLSDKLIEVAKASNIPDLARSFGEHVSSAVTALGDALQFVTKHAHALKVALEALVAIKIASIAIPVLATANWAAAGAGIEKFVVGLLGIQKLLPIITSFAGTVAAAIPLLAEAGGVSYVFGTALAAIGGPITLAIAGIVALGATVYHFRDALFQFEGETYHVGDIWSAVWIQMEKPMQWLSDRFHAIVNLMGKAWDAFANGLRTAIVGAISNISPIFAALIPGFDKALAEAKRRREAAGFKVNGPPTPGPTQSLAPAVTAGLGPEKKDVYAEAIAKINQAILAQQRFASVLHGTPDAISGVNVAMKAEAEILKLNTERMDAHLPKLTAIQEATIRQRMAFEESLAVVNAYGKELVSQSQASELATIQARKLAAATLEGDEALERAAIENEMLARTWGKSEAAIKALKLELDDLKTKLQDAAVAQKILAANNDTKNILEEIAAREGMVAAIFGGDQAMREASLNAKVYALDQKILMETDTQVRDALVRKKQAIVDLTHAEWGEADAQKAVALFSPVERLQRELDSLRGATEALKKLDGGTLTYGHALELAAKQQELFNKAIDETVASLLRQDSAKAGMTAFFLDMQKQAKTTASIIYDALHSTFEKLADNLTELLTGGKADFGKMMQDIGKQMVKSSIQKGLQEGIGAIGKAFGVDLGSALGGKPDGSSESSALWVRMASAGAGGGGSLGGALASAGAGGKGIGEALSGAVGKLGGAFSGIGKGIGSLFGKLFGGGAGGGVDFGGFYATGGYVSPGKAYIAGEGGRAELITAGPGGDSVMSNAVARRTFGGGGVTHTGNINVDARGAQQGVEQQVYRAIRAAHDSSIAMSLQASQERMQRVPQ